MSSGLGQERRAVPRPVAPHSAVVAPARPPGTMPGAPSRRRWETRYKASAILVDLVAVTIAVVVGNVLGLGSQAPWFGTVSPWLGIGAGMLIVVSLVVNRAWDVRILGQGPKEFGKLIRSVVVAAVTLGVLGLALEATAVRPWVFGLMWLAGGLAVVGRMGLRRWLYRMRRHGRCARSVLLVGDHDAVAEMIERTNRDVGRGWVVTGTCTPTGSGPDLSVEVNGVPVVGDLDAVAELVRRERFEIVAICRTAGWTPHRLRDLAWKLEDVPCELVVDPGLMEIAGPRLHVEPVDGLPLLCLTRPTFTGLPWVTKHVMDLVGSAVLLLLTAPLLIGFAVAVKLDGGPVFFRQTRVGRHGREFTMLKFRSMVVDAEARLADLLDANETDGPLFKLRNDPRVTPVGRFLRRYSLDELPQLLNVLGGSMSLVGPRPPLPSEVIAYCAAAERRLLVRPGLTGLWQVSGRSDLSWEQSVRLDLRYVENWNLALDAAILWKTVGAVVNSRGAY